MMTSKFVGYFLEEVSDWQKKLSTADSVITIWFEVQRTWSHLESIFIGSEDIRAQLPEHSKQFDTIDTDFKVDIPSDDLYVAKWSIFLTKIVSENVSLCCLVCVCVCVCVQALAAEAAATPNVVKATNRPRLYDELEDIQKRLSVCEKALAEYLETKRLAFPRFYFISSADLLDILSKGNQPVEVCIIYI